MNILVVSDDANKVREISSKLVFLRNDDKVVLTDYKNFERDITATRAEIILVHENDDRSETKFVIKQLDKYRNITVILVPKSYDANFILSCFDVGADDFILEDADDFEFVIRIVKHIKYNSANINSYRNTMLLEQFNAIDKETGFYTYEYAKQAIENTIDNELIMQGTFVVFSPNNDDVQNFSSEKFSRAIKSTLRACDIPAHGKGLQFYLFLPQTDMNGAIVVYNKISELLDFKFHAGIADISKADFKDFEKNAMQALTEAKATNADYILYQNEEKTLDNWLDDTPVKNYKIFRQIFNKKLERVITPVFYRIQQSYDGKLKNAKINQEINGDKCCFSISDDTNESTLTMIYSGFSKILVYIVHKGLNSPENKEIELKLSEVTEKGLISIIENFVNEFKNQSVDLQKD